MAKKRILKILRIGFSLIITAVLMLVPSAVYACQGPVTTVFLVRHAEKASRPSQDPPLTEAGLERAETLCRLLQKENVSVIFSTGYQRTLQTVQALAKAMDLPVTRYDAGNFLGLARRIRSDFPGKTILVAGHSNTVPGIIEALGAGPVSPIADNEYDNLYRVTLTNGKARVSMVKFGRAGI